MLMTTCVQDREDVRRFIRHPACIPVRCRILHESISREYRLRDLSFGGMSFVSTLVYDVGALVELAFPSLRYTATLRGQIVWNDAASADGGAVRHGARFLDENTHFQARLIEQVCRIESYRRAQALEFGRELTVQQAAEEWIARHASSFGG